MALPSQITRKLLSATSDKVTLNRQILRWRKSFKEVDKLINTGRKAGDKKKKN